MLFRTILIAALVCGADAFGRKKNEQNKEGLAGLMDDLNEEDARRVQQDATGGARDYELENLARRRAGEINDAELGFANMQHAMKDPAALAEVTELMQDPNNMREVQKMMQDPAFQAQAKKMMANMPDMAQMMQDPAIQAKMQQAMRDPATLAKAQQLAQAMGMGGAGAGMGGGGAADELSRLRAENAALKRAQMHA
jgi:hypothetical protein